jgi:hypothetical protein
VKAERRSAPGIFTPAIAAPSAGPQSAPHSLRQDNKV